MTTLNIGKKVTVIIEIGGFAKIYEEKFSNFRSLITQNTVKITGISTVSKFEKYEKILLDLGYTRSIVNFFKDQEIEGKSIYGYSIEYSK